MTGHLARRTDDRQMKEALKWYPMGNGQMKFEKSVGRNEQEPPEPEKNGSMLERTSINGDGLDRE